jgi:hypothetical protein
MISSNVFTSYHYTMEHIEPSHGENDFNIFSNRTYDATRGPPSSRASHELANHAGMLPAGAAHRLVK